jgi:hypothetical protein
VRVRADRLDTERASLPDRLLRDIAADVLAANERDMLAELGGEESISRRRCSFSSAAISMNTRALAG